MEMTIDGRSFSVEETTSNQLVAKVTAGLGGPLTSCLFCSNMVKEINIGGLNSVKENWYKCHYIMWAIFD